MKIDLHNHTPLCRHAEGEPRLFVEAAISQNINVFGFSDHAPMNFDQKWRMTSEDMPDYEEEIARLQNDYAGRIELLLAYEVDWLPGHLEERVLEANVDYLIGSVHFIKEWGFDNPEFLGYYKNRDPDATWKEYFDLIEAMAKSGLFQIVGHLDLLKVFNFLPDTDIRLLAQKAFKAIKASRMALELNSAGLRKPVGEIYPSRPLLELAKEMDIPITFGCDAHRVEQVGAGLDELYTLAKEIGYSECLIFRQKEREVIKF